MTFNVVSECVCLQFDISDIIVEPPTLQPNQTIVDFVSDELLANLEVATAEEAVQIVFGVDEVLKDRYI